MLFGTVLLLYACSNKLYQNTQLIRIKLLADLNSNKHVLSEKAAAAVSAISLYSLHQHRILCSSSGSLEAITHFHPAGGTKAWLWEHYSAGCCCHVYQLYEKQLLHLLYKRIKHIRTINNHCMFFFYS